MARRAARDERGAQCYMALRIASTAASHQKKSSHSSPRGRAAAVGWRWRARLVVHAFRGLREGGGGHTDWQSAAARAAWAAVRANATTTATATATPPLVEGDTSGNATAAAATPPLQEPSKEPVRIQIERRLLKSFAAERDRSSKNLVVPPGTFSRA